MKELNSFSDYMKFTFESNKENICFLKVNINLSNGHLMKAWILKPQTVISIWIIHNLIPTISNVL